MSPPRKRTGARPSSSTRKKGSPAPKAATGAPDASAGLVYRGSPKHKNRPAVGRKGTRCPEWTHAPAPAPLGVHPDRHEWAESIAQVLLTASEADPDGSGKRYATEHGVAFVAQDTRDGTWHGYPEPWDRVPAALKTKWQTEGKVRNADLRRYSDKEPDDLDWAL